MNHQQQEQLEQQRKIWNLYSGGWKKWDERIATGTSPITQKLIETLNLKGTEHVLDVASGPGEPGLSISDLLPKGKVTAIDLSEKMVEIANENAKAKNILNYHSKVADSSNIPFEENSFDHVVCRFGIMFFPDLEGSLKEMTRVLKPGGKLAVVVWAAPEFNSFLALLGGVVTEKLSLPKPQPGAPGIFRCAEPGFTSRLLTNAGLKDVTEMDINGKMVYDSPEQYWQVSTDLAGPIMEVLKSAPPDKAEDVKKTVIDKSRKFASDEQLLFPWKAIIAAGIQK